MQVENQQSPSNSSRSGQDARREILAILAESGLVPGQGVEAILERISGEVRG